MRSHGFIVGYLLRQKLCICKVELLIEMSFELRRAQIVFNLLDSCFAAFIEVSLVKVEVRKVRQERWLHFFILNVFTSNTSNPWVNHYFLDSIH